MDFQAMSNSDKANSNAFHSELSFKAPEARHSSNSASDSICPLAERSVRPISHASSMACRRSTQRLATFSSNAIKSRAFSICGTAERPAAEANRRQAFSTSSFPLTSRAISLRQVAIGMKRSAFNPLRNPYPTKASDPSSPKGSSNASNLTSPSFWAPSPGAEVASAMSVCDFSMASLSDSHNASWACHCRRCRSSQSPRQPASSFRDHTPLPEDNTASTSKNS